MTEESDCDDGPWETSDFEDDACQFHVMNTAFPPDLVELARRAVAALSVAEQDSSEFEPLEWAVRSMDDAPIDSSMDRILGRGVGSGEQVLLLIQFEALTDEHRWQRAQSGDGLGATVWRLSSSAAESDHALQLAVVSSAPGQQLGTVRVKADRDVAQPSGRPETRFSEPLVDGAHRLFEVLSLPGPTEHEFNGFRRPAFRFSAGPQALSCVRIFTDGRREQVRVTLEQSAREALQGADALVYAPESLGPGRHWRAFVVAPGWTNERARVVVERASGVTGKFPSPSIDAEREVAPDAWAFDVSAPSSD